MFCLLTQQLYHGGDSNNIPSGLVLEQGARTRKEKEKEKEKSDFYSPSFDGATVAFCLVVTQQSTRGGAAI